MIIFDILCYLGMNTIREVFLIGQLLHFGSTLYPQAWSF